MVVVTSVSFVHDIKYIGLFLESWENPIRYWSRFSPLSRTDAFHSEITFWIIFCFTPLVIKLIIKKSVLRNLFTHHNIVEWSEGG